MGISESNDIDKKTSQDASRKPRLLCYVCQVVGHETSQCREIICKHCGVKGHARKDCPMYQQDKIEQVPFRLLEETDASTAKSFLHSCSCDELPKRSSYKFLFLDLKIVTIFHRKFMSVSDCRRIKG